MAKRLTKAALRDRNVFQVQYGDEVEEVVSLLALGYDSIQVSRNSYIPVGRVRAIKANLTRGTYYPWAMVDVLTNKVVGTCKY